MNLPLYKRGQKWTILYLNYNGSRRLVRVKIITR